MVRVKSTANGARLIDLDQIIAPETPGTFSMNAAAMLRQQLLAELAATSLPQPVKNEIAGSIQVNQTGNGRASVSITSPKAGDVEFGSLDAPEQPFITRAQIQAEQRFNALITETLQPRPATTRNRATNKGASS